MTGNLAITGNRITSLANPTSSQDAANKNYVDGQGSLWVAKVGDTMTGNLSMSGHSVTDVSLPVSDIDVTNKVYLKGIEI